MKNKRAIAITIAILVAIISLSAVAKEPITEAKSLGPQPKISKEAQPAYTALQKARRALVFTRKLSLEQRITLKEKAIKALEQQIKKGEGKIEEFKKRIKQHKADIRELKKQKRVKKVKAPKEKKEDKKNK